MGLHDKFKVVVIDKCHVVKSINADVTTSVRWLQPDFTILASGTPLPGGVKDIKGYLSLIEHSDIPKWYEELPHLIYLQT